MEAYSGFAEVYDLFMDNVPYGEWCRYLTGLLRDFGVEEGLVLDLGCGTGTMTELLAGAGYDMIGVDNSEEMLEMAAAKREASSSTLAFGGSLSEMRGTEPASTRSLPRYSGLA